jgi:hypothetical protein
MMTGFAIVGGLILASCGSGLLIARRMRDLSWAHCPETKAVVQSSCTYITDDHSRYIGFVMYSYKVAAQTYCGTCQRSFTTLRGALYFIEDCSASRLSVRYKTENPEESCLFECEQAEMASQFVEPEHVSIN